MDMRTISDDGWKWFRVSSVERRATANMAPPPCDPYVSMNVELTIVAFPDARYTDPPLSCAMVPLKLQSMISKLVPDTAPPRPAERQD